MECNLGFLGGFCSSSFRCSIWLWMSRLLFCACLSVDRQRIVPWFRLLYQSALVLCPFFRVGFRQQNFWCLFLAVNILLYVLLLGDVEVSGVYVSPTLVFLGGSLVVQFIPEVFSSVLATMFRFLLVSSVLYLSTSLKGVSFFSYRSTIRSSVSLCPFRELDLRGLFRGLRFFCFLIGQNLLL